MMAPQFPETSLANDVARLRQVLRRQTGPSVVVGHSYGGQIMTALGTDAGGVAGFGFVAPVGAGEGGSLGGFPWWGPPAPAAAGLLADGGGVVLAPGGGICGH